MSSRGCTSAPQPGARSPRGNGIWRRCMLWRPGIPNSSSAGRRRQRFSAWSWLGPRIPFTCWTPGAPAGCPVRSGPSSRVTSARSRVRTGSCSPRARHDRRRRPGKHAGRRTRLRRCAQAKGTGRHDRTAPGGERVTPLVPVSATGPLGAGSRDRHPRERAGVAQPRCHGVRRFRTSRASSRLPHGRRRGSCRLLLARS